MFVAAVKKALSLTLTAHFKPTFLSSTLYLRFYEGVSAINMAKHFQVSYRALPCNFPHLHSGNWAGTENCAGREAAACSQCQGEDGPSGLQKIAVSPTHDWYHRQKPQLLLAHLHVLCCWLILIGTASWKYFSSYCFAEQVCCSFNREISYKIVGTNMIVTYT